MSFNREAFGQQFQKALSTLTESEKITRNTLSWLSRDILTATHETGDVAYMNQLLGVITPVNRKVCVLFFKTFTGYSYDEEKALFTKKSKKRYDKAHAMFVQFMEDPLNNVWTWAARHVEVEQKPFGEDNLVKYLTSARNKLQGKMSDADILRAVFKAGVSADAVIEIMDELGFDVREEDAPKTPD